MDVGEGGRELLASGLAIVDAIMLCILAFFLWNPHDFGFSFDRHVWDLHFFAFFDWIFPFHNMSFRVDIGIFRMWIFSSMHFYFSIHIVMRSHGKMMRSFMRWRCCQNQYWHMLLWVRKECMESRW